MAFEGSFKVAGAAGLLAAGAAGAAGSLQVEPMQAVIAGGLILAGGAGVIQACKKFKAVGGIIKEGVEALKELKDTAMQGLQALESTKVQVLDLQVSNEGLYDRMDKCGPGDAGERCEAPRLPGHC